MSDIDVLSVNELYRDMITQKLLNQKMLTNTERQFQQDPNCIDFADKWNAVKAFNENRERDIERRATGVPDFDDFVLRESSEAMAARMHADRFVIGRLAIMGQSTVFYGGPNVGKTLIVLKLLTEAIQ